MECRLQLERELLNLEKKNLESGDEEESLGEQSVIGDDDSNEDLGATNGHPSFEGTGSESLQEIDLGSLKVTELEMVHRGLGAAQESQGGGKPEPRSQISRPASMQEGKVFKMKKSSQVSYS